MTAAACTADSPGSFCLYHYQFVVAPAWFVAIEWAVLVVFLALATAWVLQRSRRRRP